MTSTLVLAGFAAGTLLLLGPIPPALARWRWLRRSPRAALTMWQAVAGMGVLCTLSIGPVAVLLSWRDLNQHSALRVLTMLCLLFTALLTARLLVNAHLVGTRLRAARTQHRGLVDFLGQHVDARTRMLEHADPAAYCLPATLRHRMVLTQGAVQILSEQELQAVLAHENAHLRERHDLILEFFTVLHTSVPDRLRSNAAINEVRLLVEILADRAARRSTGAVPLARALVTMATAPQPRTALGFGCNALTRIELLSQRDLPRTATCAVYLASVGLVLLPVAALSGLLMQ